MGKGGSKDEKPMERIRAKPQCYAPEGPIASKSEPMGYM